MPNIQNYIEENKVTQFDKVREHLDSLSVFSKIEQKWAKLGRGIISFTDFQEIMALSLLPLRFRFQYIDKPFESIGNRYQVNDSGFEIDFGVCTARFPRETIRYIRLRPYNESVIHSARKNRNHIQFLKIGINSDGIGPSSLEIAICFGV